MNQILRNNLTKVISSSEINKRVIEIANDINSRYRSKSPLAIGVLNGSFIFFADLVRCLNIDVEVSFIKARSYSGKQKSNTIKFDFFDLKNIKGKDIIIIEDIVDTGNTICSVIDEIKNYSPESVEVATLLFNPAAYQKQTTINYAVINVGNEFLVGFGLDYNGIGRNLEDIYIIEEKS